MKLHLSLLSIFATVITGIPTVPVQRAIDLERFENPVVAKGQYGRRGKHVERKGVESRVVNGNTLLCSAANCGTPTIAVCDANIKTTSFGTPDSQICSTGPFGIGIGFRSPCVIQFLNQLPNDETTCISAALFIELVHDVLNSCVNNTELGVGGCVELEGSGGHVCVGTSESDKCF